MDEECAKNRGLDSLVGFYDCIRLEGRDVVSTSIRERVDSFYSEEYGATDHPFSQRGQKMCYAHDIPDDLAAVLDEAGRSLRSATTATSPP